MAYLGSWKIDDWLTFYCNTHNASTGAATDADAVPSYRIYEDETGAAITNGNMALLDAANTVGFYSERLQLLAATGFEKGKQYAIYISATVATIEGTIHHTFQIEAEVDANTVSPTVSADVVSISGDGAAADNLEAACDGGSYNVGGGAIIAASVTGNVGGNVAGSVGSVTGAVGSVAGNVGGNVTGSVGSVVATVDADVVSVSGDAGAADNLELDYDGTGYAKANSIIGTCTTNTDMRGTDNALLAASIPANFGVLSITAVTGRVDVASIEGADATNQIRDSVVDDATRIDASALNTLSGHSPDNTIADVDDITGLNDLSAAQVNAECDTALVDYDPPTKAELDAGLAALNDPTASAVALAVGQRSIPDSYSADGAQPTIEQAILAIQQFLQERSVVATTVTVRKPDGATAAMTFTLDDATDPTSITRSG